MHALATAIDPTTPATPTEAALFDDEVELARFTRWTDTRDGRRIAESSLRIGGMHCAACAGTIEQALRCVDGVIDARVSAAGQCATVRWNAGQTRPSTLVQAVERAGYSAVPDTAAGARTLRRKEARDALWRVFVAAFCSMQIMMLATPSYVSAAGELPIDLKQLLDWGSWLLALPVLCFSAMPFFSGAWRSARARRVGMDVPVALGIAVAFLASSGATFDPGGLFGSEVYFDSLTMFVSFLLGGRYLEMRARHRAAQSLEASLADMPQAVLRVAADGSVETVSVHRLRAGDLLRVPVGQAFAADGPVVEGRTEVDESLLSGESKPVGKRVGETVVAGSVNRGAPVVMRVERIGADTRYEQIMALMRQAQSERTATLRSGERWAGPFLWVVLVLAAVGAAAWSVVDPSRAVWVAVSVLIVTCPCALSLAGPSALLAAAGAMARRGVLLRRLDAIEGLARMQTLFVDKTGTLTESRLALARMQRLDGAGTLEDAELKRMAAALAAWSHHPLAQSLAASLDSARGVALHDIEEIAGRGMQARDANGALWQLGAASWLGLTVDAHDDAGVWLGCDGRAVAAFHFEERLRDDTVPCIESLQRDGVHVALISGDSARRVERVAQQAGVSDWRGGMQPEDKLVALRGAQRQDHVVAMIGDGINDAPVLAQADVSLAMGEGAWVARAEADGVLVSNGLNDLVRARVLARKTLRIVRQNMLWAAVYNAACVPLALVGWLPPWAAGLGMATSSLFVVLNSLRLAR